MAYYLARPLHVLLRGNLDQSLYLLPRLCQERIIDPDEPNEG